jgi:hypothetical protein
VKEVGIAGLPYSGRSTMFRALTRSGTAGGRSNQAVVDVPDERVERLAEIERSRKKVHAKVRFVDVPGGLTAQGLSELRNGDALCIVGRDLAAVEAELILSDLGSIEAALTKATKKARTDPAAKQETATLERAVAMLEAEKPLRAEPWEAGDRTSLRGFGLLSLKPWIVVANVAEGAAAPSGQWIAIDASLEAEVAGMDPDEASELLAGFGVERSGLDLVVEACYRALDLVTFLTTGTDETRAWEVRRGALAPEAAGVIHSDLQRGFIRAEVVGYEDLIAAGSWDAAKAAGKLRVEGKDYLVAEGDVMHVRFAV